MYISYVSHEKFSEFILENLQEFSKSVSLTLTLEELLAFKDRHFISDHLWKDVIHTFDVKGKCLIHYVKQLCEQINTTIKIQKTANGAEISVDSILHYLLKKQPSKD